MRPVRSSEKKIFLEALDIESKVERSVFVDAACLGDAALLASVTALLREHERDNNPVDTPIVAKHDLRPSANDETESYTAMNQSFSRQALGTMIGPYKLMEQIGEGGFGLVYVADQQSPIRRRVALKIIKPGMDSREVLTRFEAERQAIALMDHPNIARVYDAGVTESAQPFFVMELVKLTKKSDGKFEAEEVYFTTNMQNHHGGMIVVDCALYGANGGNGGGMMACIDFKTGETLWRDRKGPKGSLLYADGRLYLRSEEGAVLLVEPSKERFVERGRFEQPDRSSAMAWAHPVVANGKLCIRDQGLLLCYDVKAK